MSVSADLIAGIKVACHWCDRVVTASEARHIPDDLPDDCYVFNDWCFSTCPVCYEEIVHERRSEIALKHGEG